MEVNALFAEETIAVEAASQDFVVGFLAAHTGNKLSSNWAVMYERKNIIEKYFSKAHSVHFLATLT